MDKAKTDNKITIDKTSTTPLYLQIEALLRNLIMNGYLEKLEHPITEMFLQEQLNVSRNTIRQAVSKLVDEGLFVRKRARGISVVKNASRIMGETTNGLCFTEAAIKRGQVPTAKLLHTEINEPKEYIRVILSMKKGEKTFYSKRIRFLDGNPASITDSYVPIKIAPGISADDFLDTGSNQSLHYLLERIHNLIILKWVETIEAVSITEENAGILGVEKESPVILRKDVVYSTEGKIIAYNETVMTSNYQIRGLVYIKERL
jgi:GntR family transcriptional regulator